MADTHVLVPPLIMLAAAVLVSAGVHRLRLSPILGYLLAGLFIGPYGLKFIENTPTTALLAELGVVFLLFAIGLELPVERLRVMRRYVFGLGTAQVVLTTLALGAVALLLGASWEQAIIVGGALALSSTAFVVQLMGERGELPSRAGRKAFAILLLQDLAVVPMLVMIPLLHYESGSIPLALFEAGIKAVAAIIIILLIGRHVLRPFYQTIAVRRNPELFTAMTLLVVLGISLLTHSFGVSMAMGAFLAGLLLSETEFRHQIAAEIEPFRGLLLGLFFMTVGMAINLNFLFQQPLLILNLTLGFIVLKAGIIYSLSLFFGGSRNVAARVAILLAQGGEFAFVLFSVALAQNLLDTRAVQILLLVVALSMALTPVIVKYASRWLEDNMDEAKPLPPEEEIIFETHDNHIIIIGCGRVGGTIAQLLQAEHIPFVAIDIDAERVTQARAKGWQAFYGDATRPHVLRAMGVDNARAIVLAIGSRTASLKLIRHIKKHHPHLPIFGRARDAEHAQAMEAAGATATVPITLHASLELGGTLLKILGHDKEKIDSLVSDLRRRQHSV
ncbi:MAG: monovalent cation:proton antiporter-2 (CPA2) family protein [Dongiaceae bacterium]